MTITQANERAQAAFVAALEARDRAGQWTQPEVDEYLNAERDVDFAAVLHSVDDCACDDCVERVGLLWSRSA
jgi:hypothetical protein